MNELQLFSYMGNQVRVVEQEGEPWFVAADVCGVLDVGNPSQALSRLDDDEKNTIILNEGIPGNPNLSVINEPGLYALVLGSRKPEAKAFKRWITHEVIPTIRRHGAYMTPETLKAAILNPDTIIQIATALKDEQSKNKALQAENSELLVDNHIMKPKAEYFDDLVDRNLLTNIRETAKQLQVGEKEFIRFMLKHKYLYRDKRGKLLPYADKNNGLFEVKECINEKTNWSGTQTLVTPKGRETFRLLCISMAG